MTASPKKLLLFAAVFLACLWLPAESPRFQAALIEGMAMVRDYAREHGLLCLVPAFFIAGAIAVFLSKESVMRRLGPDAPQTVAYALASVSGGILAVCSCTVLPVFAGIWRMGAGIGPAVAFLYAGPAVSILAIVLTARVLGPELALARLAGSVLLGITIGLLMARLFPQKPSAPTPAGASSHPSAPLENSAPLCGPLLIGLLTAILIFANWSSQSGGLLGAVASAKWWLVSALALALAAVLRAGYGVPWQKLAAAAAAVAATAFLSALAPPGPLVSQLPFAAGSLVLASIAATSQGELHAWWETTWDFAQMITPALLGGVFAAGFLFGRPGHEGLIPSSFIAAAVGAESLGAITISAVSGALMYFATLTEVPILQGLMGSGMGRGPALALLLAGPALSLPGLLGLSRIFGIKKTLTYAALVVLLAILAAWLYGLGTAA